MVTEGLKILLLLLTTTTLTIRVGCIQGQGCDKWKLSTASELVTSLSVVTLTTSRDLVDIMTSGA